MKRLLIIFLFSSILISGCNNDISDKRIEADNRKEVPKYTDSFINAEQDKIIGDLKFGMSEKEAKKEMEKFDPPYEPGHKKSIGNFDYDFIRAKYDSNKLYSIILSITLGKWDNFDELRNLIEPKFGKPDSDKVEWQRDSCNYQHRILWTIGKKEIEIFNEISDCKTSLTFIEIYLPDIQHKVYEREEQIKNKVKDSLTNAAKNVF